MERLGDRRRVGRELVGAPANSVLISRVQVDSSGRAVRALEPGAYSLCLPQANMALRNRQDPGPALCVYGDLVAGGELDLDVTKLTAAKEVVPSVRRRRYRKAREASAGGYIPAAPPAMAGTIATTSPGLRAVAFSCRKRMSSSLTKMRT